MFKQIWHLIREGFAAFVRDEALTRGAAIAFYAVTAVAPVLYIAATIAGLIFGRTAARDAIGGVLGHIMSRDSVALLELAIRNARGTSTGIFEGIVGLVTLIATASGVFGEMEDALNAIWKAPRKGALLLRLLRGRAVSLALVISLGLLLVFTMILTAAVAVLGRYFDLHTAYSEFAIGMFNVAFSFLMTTILFAAIYKVLPNKDIEWRDVLAGAVGTALLFQIGQFLLGYYLESSTLATPYGAAGGLIALLIWVYYSAQVFLLGAEFTKVYSETYGSMRNEDSETQHLPSPVLGGGNFQIST
jgi:membrane protein